MNLLLLFFSIILTVCDSRVLKVHISYPTEILGTNSDVYFGNLTLDRLTCFGNRDYGVPTYVETFLCMIRLPVGINCHSIWGSRSVVVEVKGSAEFFKLNRLPPSSLFNEYVSLNATRWLELATLSSESIQKEVKEVAAEPIYICGRSNDWNGADAQFHLTFKPVYIREADKILCHSKTLIHLIMVTAFSSIMLLPYMAAIVVAFLTFTHGINIFIAILVFSCCIVSLAPLMLTRKNRHLARLYLKYFFTRIQADETRMVIRQRLPLFQALFFSSALMCFGSALAYTIYIYCGIHRETRNFFVKITIGIASSWFIFFLCRSYERFVKDWVWVPMAVTLAQVLVLHLNPLSRDEMIVTALFISLTVSYTSPKVYNFLINRFPSSILFELLQQMGGVIAIGLGLKAGLGMSGLTNEDIEYNREGYVTELEEKWNSLHKRDKLQQLIPYTWMKWRLWSHKMRSVLRLRRRSYRNVNNSNKDFDEKNGGDINADHSNLLKKVDPSSILLPPLPSSSISQLSSTALLNFVRNASSASLDNFGLAEFDSGTSLTSTRSLKFPG